MERNYYRARFRGQGGRGGGVRKKSSISLFCRYGTYTLDEIMKTEASCSCGTMKIPPCSKTINAGKIPNFCNPSPARGDRSIGMNYSNVSLIVMNQSINQLF